MDALVVFDGLGEDPAAIRAALDTLSWSLFDSRLRSVPRGTLAAVIRVTAPHRARLDSRQARLLTAIEQHWAAQS